MGRLYRQDDAERDAHGRTVREALMHRRAVAALLCFCAIVFIAVWNGVGWHLRFRLIEKQPVSDTELYESVYYDKIERILFTVITGHEPLFGENSNGVGEPFYLTKKVRRSDYAYRYWYENKSILTELLEKFNPDGCEYEFEIDSEKQWLTGVTVTMPGNKADCRELTSRLTAALESVRLERNYFTDYHLEGGPVTAVLAYQDGGSRDVRLAFSW